MHGWMEASQPTASQPAERTVGFLLQRPAQDILLHDSSCYVVAQAMPLYGFIRLGYVVSPSNPRFNSPRQELRQLGVAYLLFSEVPGAPPKS